MDSKPKKTRKITIKDVLNEHELELLGIKESIDGTPVNSSRKINEFLHDCGMRESPEYLEVQARYRDKMKDKEERKKYFQEIAAFIKKYYRKHVDDYLNSLDKNEIK